MTDKNIDGLREFASRHENVRRRCVVRPGNGNAGFGVSASASQAKRNSGIEGISQTNSHMASREFVTFVSSIRHLRLRSSQNRRDTTGAAIPLTATRRANINLSRLS